MYFSKMYQALRVNFVVFTAWRVVQVPRISTEQEKQVLESLIGHVELLVLLLDMVLRNRPPLRYLIAPSRLRASAERLSSGLANPSKNCNLRKLEKNWFCGHAFGLSASLSFQIVDVAAVEEPLLLQEVNEHQPVQEHRRVPASLPLVGHTFEQIQESNVLFLKFAIELLVTFSTSRAVRSLRATSTMLTLPSAFEFAQIEVHWTSLLMNRSPAGL